MNQDRARRKRERRRLRIRLPGRTVELHGEQADQVRTALERQRERFRAKFGRDPGPDDPVFFDPSADTPQFYSEEMKRQHRRDMVEAMKKAGLPPMFIYAYEKTGMIVTKGNLDKWSKADLAEFHAACDEFERLERAKP